MDKISSPYIVGTLFIAISGARKNGAITRETFTSIVAGVLLAITASLISNTTVAPIARALGYLFALAAFFRLVGEWYSTKENTK